MDVFQQKGNKKPGIAAFPAQALLYKKTVIFASFKRIVGAVF
jgi:hypothetical protein